MASRVLGAFVVTAAAAVASLALATPASAHTPNSSAYCDAKAKKTTLTVTLTQYQGTTNKVIVTDGDKELKNENFPQNFRQTWDNLDPTVEHKLRVKVVPSDGQGKYDKTHTVEACVAKPPKPEQPQPPKPEQPNPPKPEEPKPPVETTTEAPSSSVTPPAPAPGGSTPEPPLAATGASPLWLLLSGLGLVGAGAGTLLFLRRRRSA